MKNFIKYSFMAMLLVVLLSNCEKGTEPILENKEIFPLKVGNYWIWVNIEYDSLGNSISEELDTLRVRAEYDWDNTKYYGVSGGDTTSDIRWVYSCYQNREDGCYRLSFWKIIDSNNVERDSISKSLFLKYPGNNGDIYTYSFGLTTDTIEIETNNYKYQLDIGSFDCYKYVFKNSKKIYAYYVHYYCPGVGRIASEYYQTLFNEEKYLKSKSELIEYKVIP